MRKALFLLVVPVVMVFFNGCLLNDDDDEIVVEETKPVVSALQPSTGKHGEQIAIKGSRLTSAEGPTSVTFNGKGAQIVSVTDTMIVAVVPLRSGAGPVRVFNGDELGVGPVFNYIYTITVSTFCGDGTAGHLDGGPLTAKFNSPAGLSADESGNIYVADRLNHRIRRIASNGFVTTIAGNGQPGHFDGTPANTRFNEPTGVSYDKITGDVFVADRNNHCIRIVKFTGVNTVAGTPGGAGYVDGTATVARMNGPTDVQVYTENAELFITDAGNNCIRHMDENGVLSTFAGTNQPGLIDGQGTSSRFNTPYAITYDSTGYFFVTDIVNNNVRRITLDGLVSTAAGSGAKGYADGSAPLAAFDEPSGIAMIGQVGFLCDRNNHRIRGISVPGNLVTTVAGASMTGLVNGDGSQARFNEPGGMVQTDEATFYISDAANHVIRKMVVE